MSGGRRHIRRTARRIACCRLGVSGAVRSVRPGQGRGYRFASSEERRHHARQS